MTRERGIRIKTLRGALSDLGVATPDPTPTATRTPTQTPTSRSETTPAGETEDGSGGGAFSLLPRLVRRLFDTFGIRL